MSKKKTKKRLTKPVVKIISIIAICISIYLLIGVVKEVYTMIELRNESERVSEELARLKEENATLISKRDKLEDPEYVMTYARGNYMFSKDGEQIFYLPSSNKTTENSDSE